MYQLFVRGFTLRDGFRVGKEMCNMELIKLPITKEFIHKRTLLTWREILFGIDAELLAGGAAVGFAMDRLEAAVEPSDELVELAFLSPSERARDLVDKLACMEPEQVADEIREKWLYLTLAWLYENREQLRDPLSSVDEVYADFGYPKVIANFVRWAPMEGRDLGSVEANVGRLYENWRRYLEASAARYARR